MGDEKVNNFTDLRYSLGLLALSTALFMSDCWRAVWIIW